jgi:tRNA threonylcarbamoyladenosine biosynthesis protein TsaE
MSHFTPDGHHRMSLPPNARRSRIAVTQEELVRWGKAFGHAVRTPLVVTLAGELGAGKTTLAQAICRGFGVTDDVTSPTYALVHEYRGTHGRVYHLDLYRLKSVDELTNIGWDDILAAEDALVLVEWPERAGDRLPNDAVPIDLEYAPDDDSVRVLLAG